MFSLLFTILLLFGDGSTSGTFSAKVIKVVDGNTIEVHNSDKEVVLLLLNGVDCPEPGQPAADHAKAFTEKMVLKKKVTIVLHGKDRWGNKLATVLLNGGTNLNHELVKSGLAWAHPSADKTVVSFQEEAKANKLGLWQTEDPTPPWVYKRQQTMMAPKGR
ncbi:nuclease (SNase-like) [Fulvivirga imtechensis AK7]|uniref:Nuclease (SNase-like) n=1 Tax=Fulvivirga imtechensis AK7 TaxID=1237149 RepID=L8JSS8_9BACT|nr:thermonuclease family protein [Fulvivirga imtechensis]ELR71233.1 nuclease (SNase-like) [Fulvivirga imtechensis AK7]